MSDNRIVFIRTEKTVLRPLEESDAPLLARWINDPEVRDYVSACWPIAVHAEVDWIRSLGQVKHTPTDIILMVEALDGRPIGTMGLHRIDKKNGQAITGTLIGEKDCWGKGYGTASKMHLLKYAFHELRLNRVGSAAFATNPRSIAYSKRCGYQVEGVIRQITFKGGKFIDHVMLGVLREEWERAFAEYQERVVSRRMDDEGVVG